MLESIVLKIKNWDIYNPRKDIKRPSWFAFSNRMIEDSDFFDFTGDEFKAWIYILSQASQKMADEISVNIEHAKRVCGIPISSMKSAIDKLESFQIVTEIRTQSVRARDVDVRNPYATDKQTDTTNKQTIVHFEQPSASPPERFNFESIYKLYPRKQGKSRGLKTCKVQIKTQQDFQSLGTATKNYAEYCKKNATDPRYIKLFSTFMNEWRDWLDPITGTSVESKPKGIAEILADQEKQQRKI